MSPAAIRLAARWLRDRARLVGRQHAEHLTDRRHKPRRVVELPRDVRGRWQPKERTT